MKRGPGDGTDGDRSGGRGGEPAAAAGGSAGGLPVRAWVLAAAGAAGLGSALLLWVLGQPAAAPLPDLPDLEGVPSALAAHLRRAHEAAQSPPARAEATGALAMAYHADGFYRWATACYREAARLEPRDWRWPYGEALVSEETGDAAAAAGALRRVLELEPGFALAWLRLGNALLKEGHRGEAEDAFRRALERDGRPPPAGLPVGEPRSRTFPVSAYASWGLGRVLFAAGRADEARRLLEEAAGAHPRFGPLHRLLARLHDELGRGEEARQCLARAAACSDYLPPADPMADHLARESRSSSVLLKQLSLAARSGNAAWAEFLARRAVEVDPQDAGALAELALLLLGTGRTSEALAVLERYRRAGPGDASTSSRIGYALCLAGRLAEALEWLEGALELEPRHLDARSNLAMALGQLGRVSEAEEHLREALRLQPDFAPAHKNLGAVALLRDDLEAAVRHLEEALRLRPAYAEAHAKLGSALGRRGDLEGAASHLEAALRLKPELSSTRCELAEIRARQGRGGEAERELEAVLESEPGHAGAHLGLGDLDARRGRWAQAAHHYRAALASRPRDPEGMRRLAWLLAAAPDAALRDGRKAVALAERALEVSVERTAVLLDTLAAACARSGRFDRAVEAAREALDLAGGGELREAIAARLEGYLQGRAHEEVEARGP